MQRRKERRWRRNVAFQSQCITPKKTIEKTNKKLQKHNSKTSQGRGALLFLLVLFGFVVFGLEGSEVINGWFVWSRT